MEIIQFECLSDADVQAILASLPLLFCTDFEVSEAQNDINYSLAESLGKKLIERKNLISANESRVMYLAVLLAHKHLKGEHRLDLSPELNAELSKHFFSYNKLAPSCAKALEVLESRLGLE